MLVGVEACDWWCASGSVLGPLLFAIYVNDFDENVQGMISKFADDTKIGSIVGNEEGYQKLQQNLDKLRKRTKKWQTESNMDKCEVLHFGKSDQVEETEGDLTEVYKIMRGMDRVNALSVFPRVGESRTRRHQFK
eukprot:g20206.t1